jgi:chromosome segregation protein
MSKLGFLGRKSSAPVRPPQILPVVESDKTDLDSELFGTVAAQLGENNEAVRNLLACAGHKINELDAIRDAFSKLVEPVHKALSEFETEKNEKLKLQTLLNNTRAAYAKLRAEFTAVEEKAASLEAYYTRVRDELTLGQQNLQALEQSRDEQAAELVARQAQIADLQRCLQQETAELRSTREENRRLGERIVAADKRIAEFENNVEGMRQKLVLSEKERSFLQSSLEDAAKESLRVSRRLSEAENALAGTQDRLRQTEANFQQAERERTRLAAALDDASERFQNEANAQRMRFEGLAARAATTEQLLEEARNALALRTEEVRAMDRRLADVTLTRGTIEDKLGQIETALQERDRQVAEQAQARETLTEQNEALVKAVRMRDQVIARADEKLKVGEERVRFLEGELRTALHTATEQIEDAKAALHHEQIERSVVEGALEASRKDNARMLRELSLLQSHVNPAQAAAGSLRRVA